MKPGSIIFLIVSVLIIIAGLVLCAIGVNVAQEQGVALFSTDVSVVDGDVIRSDVLDDSSINKVKMNLDDVNIHIARSDNGEAYVELHNFRVGSYDYSVQNKMLLIDNETSIFSIMRIAEGNFSFNGLRHYLTYKNGTNTQKELYLYLTESATVNTFDISCTRGNITLDDLSLTADYNISLQAGDITLTSVTTKSTFNVSTNKGIITLDNASCRQGNIVVGEGAADLFMRSIPGELSVLVENGDIECGYAASSEYGLEFILDASGEITYNGTVQTDRPFTYSNSPGPCPQTLTAKNGNVNACINAAGVTGRFADLSAALAAETASEDNNDTQTEPITDTDTEANFTTDAAAS